MALWIDDENPLPSFRDDLELYQGPLEPDGAPSYNLFDPAKGKYYKTNWAESLILQYHRPGMTLKDLVETINSHTTLKVSKEDVKHFFEEAAGHNLLSIPRTSEQMVTQYESSKGTFLKNLMYNYLYFRLPIFNPDKFLTKALPFVRPLASRPAFIIYLILSIIGIMMTLNRFGEFISTFSYFFNFQGILAYALTISVIKILHELSHAFTAKRYGINVPTMGIIFIVLWPMLYTDVTNGWKLWKRSSRIAISAAGCAIEMVLAGLSTLGWALTEPGILHSVFFLIASATWISSLLINLNPAMKFDGYYLACDISGIDNLQPRAFAVLRWKAWKFFFGIESDPPESALSNKQIRGLTIYAIFTLIYRFFLYISIAVFVYFTFTKVLGLMLAVIELWIFMVLPLIQEIAQVRKFRPKIFGNPKLMITFALLGALVLWFVIPLPHIAHFSAVSAPEEKQVVYIPESSTIEKIYVSRNDQVEKDDLLLQLRSVLLESKIEQLKLEVDTIDTQMHLLSMEGKDPSLLPRKQEELASAKFNLDRLKNLNDELTIRAKQAGEVYMWIDDLHPGLVLAKDTVIGKIADVNKVVVWAYVPEADIEMVHVGQKTEFMLGNSFDTYEGTITYVSPSRESILRFPALASIYGGPLPVSDDKLKAPGGLMKMRTSFYPVKVEVELNGQPLPFEQTGRIEVVGPWRSKLVEWVRYIISVAVRESGF